MYLGIVWKRFYSHIYGMNQNTAMTRAIIPHKYSKFYLLRITLCEMPAHKYEEYLHKTWCILLLSGWAQETVFLKVMMVTTPVWESSLLWVQTAIWNCRVKLLRRYINYTHSFFSDEPPWLEIKSREINQNYALKENLVLLLCRFWFLLGSVHVDKSSHDARSKRWLWRSESWRPRLEWSPTSAITTCCGSWHSGKRT